MSFSFGSPSSAPAATGLAGGFSFGANKPTTPGFGLAATSQPSTGLFGAPAAAATPSFGNTSFGAASTPAFGAASTPAFGATTTAAPAFGSTTAFGVASTASSFGATSTPSFGLTATPASTAAPAFGALGAAAPAFGTNPAPTTGFGAGGLNFGAGTNTSTPSTGLSFGQPAATTAATGLGGLGGFSFGGATQSTGLGFGLGTTTATSSLFGMFFTYQELQYLQENTTFANQIYSIKHALEDYAALATNNVKSFSIKMMFPNGPQIPITQSLRMHPAGHYANSGTDKYNIKYARRDCYSTIVPTCGKLGATTVTSSLPLTTATPSLGLGGVAPTTLGASNTAADAKNEPAKQQKLPNEIATSVESFKEFVKKQKALSSDVMRVSAKPLHTVSRQAEATLRETGSLRGAVSVSRAASRRQRAAAAAALAAAEAAARNHAYPGSELEGGGPPAYVRELISELEQQLATFRRQMDIADKQMQSEPKLLTEQELNSGLRCMHGALVALAGRLGAAHGAVQAQKDQYLNLRKYVLKDPSNVFDAPTQTSMLDQILKDVDTSRKKMKPGTVLDSQGRAVINDPRTALGSNVSQLAGPTPFNHMGTGLSPFPLQDASGPTWQPQSTPTLQLGTSLNISFGSTPAPDNSFQLQKPPGKRGKQ